ncbi:MAG: hypothetical protein CXX83_00760 [Methanobacteriota archaeon]|nr:MAG: hypothetical protein CXX83_00760 [Euryarchaeota archaeon]
MRQVKPVVMLILTLLLSSSLSGCIGLVASRELMEWTRGVPKTEDKVVPYSFNHTFDSTELEAIIFNPAPKEIQFDSEVKEIRIFFRVVMDCPPAPIIDCSNFTSAVRYVHARLWEPGANKNVDEPFWQDNATSDRYPPLKRFYPPFEAGTWELEVEAQAYGLTTPVDQISFHDEFEVSVSVVRPCILFPERANEEDCVPV